MKRILTSFALLTMVIAPAASFARDRDDDDRGRQDYREQRYQRQGYSGYQRQVYVEGYAQPSYQEYPAPSRYDRAGYGYDNYRQSTYAAPQSYNYGYDRNQYGYGDRDYRVGRSAKYVGGGAAAGAVLGAIIGHGTGAAIGAIVGGLGGYAYQQHNDRRYNDYGY